MDLGDTKTKGYALFQNYPNPFNPTTIITFEIPDESMVELKVFDVLGKEVSTLVRENKPAGRYSVNFDASRLSAGIYVCRLRAGQYTFSRKMSLIK